MRNSTKLLSPISQFAILALTAIAANASVVYQFTGIPSPDQGAGGVPHAFELVVPDFVNISAGQQMFSCAQLSLAFNCEGGIIFSTVISPRPFTVGLQFNDTGDDRYYLYSFPTGSLGQVGAYYSELYGDGRFDQGFMTVSLRTESPEPGPHVPEPQSLLLAFSGVALFAVGAFRRKCRLT